MIEPLFLWPLPTGGNITARAYLSQLFAAAKQLSDDHKGSWKAAVERYENRITASLQQDDLVACISDYLTKWDAENTVNGFTEPPVVKNFRAALAKHRGQGK